MMRAQPRRNVAIVGGGLAGLRCAQELLAAGCSVTLFERAEVGGRCTTALSADIGAQYFTVRDGELLEQVARWSSEGIVAAWHPRLWAVAPAQLRRDPDRVVADGVERLVGVPGMRAIAARLLRDCPGLQLHEHTRITCVRREKFDWELEDQLDRRHTGYQSVILALAAADAAPLLAGHAPTLATEAQRCVFDPCWTVVVEPEHPLALAFDAAFVSHSPLAWIADDSSKPGRSPTPRWVLQATGTWTRTMLDRSPELIISELLAAFTELTGRTVTVAQAAAHLWPDAKPEPLPVPYLVDRIGIAACGDWCGGPRIEGAIVSGRELARKLLSTWPETPRSGR